MDKRPQRYRHDKEKGVILLSGGIDSATTFYFAKKYGYRLFALIFDYQQRHKKEIECAKRIAYMNKAPYHIVRTDFPWTKSSLTQRDIKVPLNRDLHKKEIPLTYVAGRNIIFLSYAFSLAESVAAKKIFIGAHTLDYSGYPDCRPDFFQLFQSAANAGLKYKGIEIIVPLINKNKKEIIKMGLDLGVPFEYTWSCYQGGRFPCQKCDSCRFRMQAFRELRMYDPLLKKREYKKSSPQETKSKDAG